MIHNKSLKLSDLYFKTKQADHVPGLENILVIRYNSSSPNRTLVQQMRHMKSMLVENLYQILSEMFWLFASKYYATQSVIQQSTCLVP